MVDKACRPDNPYPRGASLPGNRSRDTRGHPAVNPCRWPAERADRASRSGEGFGAVSRTVSFSAGTARVLGRTPCDEAPCSAAAEARGQRFLGRDAPPAARATPAAAVRARARRHREEGGGAGAQHGGNPPAGLPEQPFQDGVEGWLHVAGRASTGRREHRCVVVDPRVAGEIAESGPACQQRMAVAGHDAGGELDETLAAQERRKRPAGVGAAAMQVALPVLQEPQALGERRRAQRQ